MDLLLITLIIFLIWDIYENITIRKEIQKAEEKLANLEKRISYE